jgi:hypothetical protein
MVLAGCSAGVLIGAFVSAMFILPLTKDQRMGFLGSAFGSLVAALTAVAVIEYQLRGEARRATAVICGLLEDADRMIERYLAASTEGELHNASGVLARIADSIEAAIGVADQNRDRSLTLARTAIRLTKLAYLCEEARSTSRGTDYEIDLDTCEALSAYQPHLRLILEGLD